MKPNKHKEQLEKLLLPRKLSPSCEAAEIVARWQRIRIFACQFSKAVQLDQNLKKRGLQGDAFRKLADVVVCEDDGDGSRRTLWEEYSEEYDAATNSLASDARFALLRGDFEFLLSLGRELRKAEKARIRRDRSERDGWPDPLAVALLSEAIKGPVNVERVVVSMFGKKDNPKFDTQVRQARRLCAAYRIETVAPGRPRNPDNPRGS